MSGGRVERRLAAILAADVAGYSQLMGEDEEGTLAALKGIRRELIDPKIAEHRGRIVKTTGDGLLVEFASVVDAVRCATSTMPNSAVSSSARIEVPSLGDHHRRSRGGGAITKCGARALASPIDGGRNPKSR